MACLAMAATLEIIETEHLVENAASKGHRLISQLSNAVKDSPLVKDVDGLALLAALVFVDASTRDAMQAGLLAEGVLGFPLGLGWGDPSILLMPPLTLGDEEVTRMTEAVIRALESVGAGIVAS
jgi:4-aminobutyrate aminotransferase